ncbi:MAG: protein kinase, partial [Polyangiales bacterium]
MNLQPGQMLTPTLRLVRQLGRGGMGSIWIADHLALETPVAVKFMAPELVANSEVRARFAREAAAASQVKSPHVVQMLDHGVTPDGVPFIAMELLQGEDLAHRVKRRGLLTPQQLSLVLTQTAKALGKAHERGIVHRDIKPENIFLCETDDDEIFIKVLDFGIAKASDSLSSSTKTGSVMGTAYYMSPEQIVGAKSMDHRTDVWALGVVTFEMMTGVKPFDGETIGALTLAIHGAPMPRPTAHLPGAAPAFDEWFARACSRDVTQRFQSAKELAKAFHAIVHGEPARRSADQTSPGLMPPPHLGSQPAYGSQPGAPGPGQGSQPAHAQQATPPHGSQPAGYGPPANFGPPQFGPPPP